MKLSHLLHHKNYLAKPFDSAMRNPRGRMVVGSTTSATSTTTTSTTGRHLVSPAGILSHLLIGLLAFHLGVVAGSGGWGSSGSSYVDNSQMPGPSKTVTRSPQKPASARQLLPDTVRGLFAGAATIPRADFIEEYDIGVPWDEPILGAKDVLLLYGSETSFPEGHADQDGKFWTVPYQTALNATVNCNTMKVILVKPGQANSCIAVVGQWDSFHLHNLMRLNADDTSGGPKFRPDYPLRVVSRRHQLSGRKMQFPLSHQTRLFWSMLIEYLQKMEATLERLKPIATEVAGDGNTVVVMVCNFGQSELLFNFVCSARARGLDLSTILLFATDAGISELAKSLGIATFDVDDAFGEMPTSAAKVYGDRTFQGMMMSKVYCVHLISALGYDLLFQDVDVVWNRDPLQYFRSAESGNFDFYFQDGTLFLAYGGSFYFLGGNS